MTTVSRPLSRAIVVISDRVEPCAPFPVDEPVRFGGGARNEAAVVGGYLERLPLAAVRHGLADFAEIWHHHRGEGIASQAETPFLTRRVFPLSRHDAPFHSQAMLDFFAAHGAPAILCVWGLGVSAEPLEACPDTVVIYNSIDVPALRVPPEVSRRFDLVLTGAQWQSDGVTARHPGMRTAILPVGPEFASAETFFPIDGEKRYDVVYVAAAQGYKRHDVLFDTLARAPRSLSALCVVGYGEDSERLRHEAQARGLRIDWVGPPGVPHAEVNRLINQARLGLVCGEDDGAPAILTEYMLAGLPVVANARLRCGLQYITPQTGLAAPAERFEHAITQALARTDWSPRETVLARWTWPHTIEKLADLIGNRSLFPRSGSLQPPATGDRLERADAR